MKGLSVRQPWALLLVQGVKDVENRSWGTEYRGPLLIHAPKAIEVIAYSYLLGRGIELPPFGDLKSGVILGSVDLVDCTQRQSSKWHEDRQWGWYVQTPVEFEQAIPWRGHLGLFEVSDEVLAAAGCKKS